MKEKAKPSGSNICLLTGEDEFNMRAKARELLDAFIPPDEQALGMEIIDADVDTVPEAVTELRQCIEAVQTVGFLGGRKAVWLRAGFLAHAIVAASRLTNETMQSLAQVIAAGIPPGHFLLITAPKMDKRSTLFKTCRDHGEHIEFALAEKPWQRGKTALPFAAKAFADAKLKISGQQLENFLATVGHDNRQISAEVAKLAIYLGERRDVSDEDIRAITTNTRENFSWELEDAIGSRKTQAALEMLRHLLFQRQEPLRIVSGLETRFRALMILQAALAQRLINLRQTGKNFIQLAPGPGQTAMPAELTQALASEKGAPMHPFIMGKLAQQAARFTAPQLCRARELIMEARRKMVSGATPPAITLELLVLKLCAPAPTVSRAVPAQAQRK